MVFGLSIVCMLLSIGTINCRTLSSTSRQLELENALKEVKCDVITLTETRIRNTRLPLPTSVKLWLLVVYAPTCAHTDAEYEKTLEDAENLLKARPLGSVPIVAGDFNARIGREQGNEDVVGPFSHRGSNPRGEILVEFLRRCNLSFKYGKAGCGHGKVRTDETNLRSTTFSPTPPSMFSTPEWLPISLSIRTIV
ncbi:hypothetical protein PRIPAC_97770 [Pristionchus pacificus]|uniref:Uncharacterized protein n=1 Tax=Pristionchus pacificus TaxID=54126 RepID=A0A2A6B3H3_PRIPA|nr:hypothetical protein PRIPAC_97770 [Pristionchus pacificus]|eukprot:PDM60429.1 hypothetical protein PRIPAC_54254 [Pristionchus pacificus]